MARPWALVLLVGCGDGGGGGDTHAADVETVELVDAGQACLFGEGAPDEPVTTGDTELLADEPVEARVVLDDCASGCATDVEASCEVRLVTGEVVVTATASYTVPTGPMDCPAVCVEVAATCASEPLPAGEWTLDYGGGHSATFTVPGTVPVPCAIAL